AIIMGLVLLIMGILDWNFYFQQYYADTRVLNARLQRPQMDNEVQTAQSRWQAALGPHYQVYIAGHTLQYYGDTTTSYLVSAPPVVRIQNLPADLPARAPPGQGMAFVFYADTIQYRDLIAQNYPGGMSGESYSPYGRPLFYSYVLPPSPLRPR
ncbi:MAG: hypothetical protein ABIQ44_07465, partial [Chloroflexia bacterium]